MLNSRRFEIYSPRESNRWWPGGQKRKSRIIRTQRHASDEPDTLLRRIACGRTASSDSFGTKQLRHQWKFAGTGHCCPRRDRPVAWPAENTRLGGTPVGYLGGGLRIKVAQPVQVIPKPG